MKKCIPILFGFSMTLSGCSKRSSPIYATNEAAKHKEIIPFEYDPAAHDSVMILPRLSGIWVHEKDSNATLNIFNYKWTFSYLTEPVDTNSIYRISLVEKLPKFVRETVQADFIVLVNKTDTMYFEILSLNDSVLSLLNYPSGRTHLYNRRK